MPYIDSLVKNAIAYGAEPQAPGPLTYVIQQTLRRYLEVNGKTYRAMAECLGALEGAKFDLYVRVIEPYEESKRQQNGDVWYVDGAGI